MNRSINSLTRYVDDDMYKHSAEGAAARHAARELLDRWAALSHAGSNANFLGDVDLVIEHFQQKGPHDYHDQYIANPDWVVQALKSFRFQAVRLLPVVNGGLDGRGMAYWERRLKSLNVELLPLKGDRWSYTGCSAGIDYEWSEEACRAAVAQYIR